MRLMCVIRIGSNFVKLEGVGGYNGSFEVRVHDDKFADCHREELEEIRKVTIDA